MSDIRKVRNEDGLIIFNALFPQIRNREFIIAKPIPIY